MQFRAAAPQFSREQGGVLHTARLVQRCGAVRIRYLQRSHGDSTVLHWRPGHPVEDRQMSEVRWMEDRGLQGDHEGRKKEEEKEEELDLLRACVVEEKDESSV